MKSLHDKIIEAVRVIRPRADVRIVPHPLRVPCDFAYTFDGTNTVVAIRTEAWENLAQRMEEGADFSAAYSRVFDRTGSDYLTLLMFMNPYARDLGQDARADTLRIKEEVQKIIKAHEQEMQDDS